MCVRIKIELTVMRIFSTTEWYSSSFRKPSRGEKPLQTAASNDTIAAATEAEGGKMHLPNSEKLDVTGVTVTTFQSLCAAVYG